MAGPNTQLNVGVSGDKVRDIDMGSSVKLQCMNQADPAVLQCYRFSYNTFQNDVIQIAGVSGIRLQVMRYKTKLGGGVSAEVSIRAGFGTVTPTSLGCVYSNPGLQPGTHDGDDYGPLGIGADGESLRITVGAITGGNLEVNCTVQLLPTAGI